MAQSSKPQRERLDPSLQEIVRRLLAVGNPQKIVLFGSRARGDARPDSDYDLLLVEPSSLPRHRRAARYRRALIGLAPPHPTTGGPSCPYRPRCAPR